MALGRHRGDRFCVGPPAVSRSSPQEESAENAPWSTPSSAGRRSRDLERFFNRLDARQILLHLGRLVLLERVANRLLITRSARQRVKSHRALELNWVPGG
jgi:hypothetical protein